jgi:hypothetical protein
VPRPRNLTDDERALLARVARDLQGDRTAPPGVSLAGRMPHPLTQADVAEALAEAGFHVYATLGHHADLIVMGDLGHHPPEFAKRQSGVIAFEELLRGEFRIEPSRDRYSRPRLVALGPDGLREVELKTREVEEQREKLARAEVELAQLKARR